MNRDFKGVWIPKEIWQNKILTLQEKVMLIEIDSLDNKDGCFASNAYFAYFFDISKSRVSQIIKSLKEKGFIKLELIYKGKEVEKRVLNILNKGSKYSKEGIKENAKGYLGNCEDNNTLNNTFNNTIKEKKFNFRKELLDFGFENDLVIDWIKVRKDKKASNTKTALNSFLNQVKKSGKDKNEILRICVERSWRSFSASWDLGNGSVNNQKQEIKVHSNR